MSTTVRNQLFPLSGDIYLISLSDDLLAGRRGPVPADEVMKNLIETLQSMDDVQVLELFENTSSVSQ